jgi:N-acetylmuramoyl-L-alanine amidase
MTYSPQDIEVLIRTVFGEARGEALLGKVAVAHVILNRANKGGWWGRTVEAVCKFPYQFSCWNENDPNRAKIIKAGVPELTECAQAVALALSGIWPDPTRGSTHYHTQAVHPEWAEGQKPAVQIGTHLFYTGIA